MKKFWASLLAFVLFFSAFQWDGAVARAASENAEGIELGLEEGYYCVPLDLKYASSQPTVNTLDKYKTALLQVGQDGIYITLRVAHYTGEYGKTIKILKEEYYPDIDSLLSSSTNIQVTFSDEAMANEEYWKKTTVVENEDLAYADITFQVEDISQPIIMLTYATAESPALKYCITITPQYSVAKRLPDTISDGTYEWYFEVNNAFENTSIIQQPEDLEIAAEMTSLFRDTVQVAVEGDTATATFTLSESRKEDIVSIELLSEHTYSPGRVYSLIGIKKHYAETVTPDENGQFPLTFDLTDYKGMVWGQDLRIQAGNHVHADHGTKKYYYYGTIRLKDTAESSLILTDQENNTGISYETTTANAPASSSLSAQALDSESTLYGLIDDYMGSSVKYWDAWTIDVVNEGSPVTLTKNGQLRIPIPERYDPEKVTLHWANVSADGTSVLTPEVSGWVDDGYFVTNTKQMGTYIFSEAYTFDQDATVLSEAGTYTVNMVVWHISEDRASMADTAIVKPVTISVDENGTKTVYMDLKAVANMQLSSYLAQMWYYGTDVEYGSGGRPTSGTLYPAITYAYLNNEEGNFYIDEFNEGTLNYYPKSVYFVLPTNDAIFPIRVNVPVMDALAGSDQSKDALFKIDYSTAVKTSENPIETPIRAAVYEALRVADSITENREEYTFATYNALMEAGKKAAEAYNNGNATKEELTEAYMKLYEATGNMETVESLKLEEGLYTAAASVGDSGIVDGARIYVDENGGYKVHLNVSGSINSFMYYNPVTKKYASVVAETAGNEEERITGVVFSLPDMSAETAVAYRTEENGELLESYLILSDPEAQAVDKDKLSGLLDDTQALLQEAKEDKDKYEADKVAALYSAEAAALVVYKDTFALQDEVDAQAALLREAIDDLKLQVNLDALAEAISNAEALDESKYTVNSWQRLMDALSDAKELLGREEVTGADADAQVILLNSAIEGLIERADKGLLEEAYLEAMEVENNNYAGWDDFVAVRSATKDMLDDTEVTQDKVNAQLIALEAAWENLSDGIQKFELEELISKAKELSTEGYSEESVAFLRAAIESAEEVLNNSGASQKQVEQQIALLESVFLVGAEDEDVLYSGTYSIEGRLWSADADAASMGNKAIVQPMEVIVDEEGNAKLRLEFVPLTTTGLTGYLAKLNYFPDWTGGDDGLTKPNGQSAASVYVEEYYDVFDEYNNPDSQYADTNIAGSKYPHYVSLDIPVRDGAFASEIWVQVYVPVMESLGKGNGTQYARLQLDWDTCEQTSGIETDKEELTASIEQAEALLAEVKDSNEGYSEESIAMLEKAIAAAKAVNESMNVSQDIVDGMANAVQVAADAFDRTVDESVDKSELKKAIEVADSYLNSADVAFTEESYANLKAALDRAQTIYDNANATQYQVNLGVNGINRAVEGLVVDGTDKTELHKALEAAATYLEATEYYSAAALDALRSLYDAALEVYEGAAATQEEVNAQVRILNYAVGNLKQVTEVSVDKTGLHTMLLAASSLAGRETQYTAASLKILKDAIKAAEDVYMDVEAAQEQVNEQCNAVALAILDLEMLPVEGSGSNNNTGNNNGANTNNGNNGSTVVPSDSSNNGNNQTSTVLDRYNLADGVYSITGKMVKIDKSTASMSNEAINHTVKLTVKNGKYYITLDFCGLNYAGQYGYLGWLKYFKSGYSLDSYKSPTGSLGAVTVDSIQKDSDGKAVRDSFGTNYPNQVTFPLISEAVGDGYVPLQVFVPIMESISAGSGTQPVYLKLSWSTLTKTTSDDKAFEDNTSKDNSDDDDDDDGNSLLNFTSTLKSSGTGSLGTSSLKTSSLKSTGSSLTGSSALKSTASSLTGSNTLKSTASALTGGASALESAEYEGFTLPETEGLAYEGIDAASANVAAQNGDGASTDDSAMPIIPFVTSVLVVIAGVLYKLKSRGLLFK